MNRMKQRYEFLDMLRGVALLGIIGVNACDITRVGDDHVASSHDMDGRMFLDFGVQCRFVPIFAILFGATMWFIADGARRRGRAGWSALLLRMVALGAIGVLHSLLYSGDILQEYAIVGAVLVPCAVWLSPWISLVVGAVLTGVSFGFVGGGLDSLPGLMFLGMGVAGVGAAAAVDRGSRWIWPALVVAIAASSALAFRQYVSDPNTDSRFTIDGTRAGLAMAIAYTCVLAALWQSRHVRAVLSAVFTPLGRMALTNYVTASAVLLATTLVVDLRGAWSVWPAVLIGVAVIIVQSFASRLWLNHFVNGPLEWSVRAVTWRTIPPMRRDSGRGSHAVPTLENAGPAASDTTPPTVIHATPTAAQ